VTESDTSGNALKAFPVSHARLWAFAVPLLLLGATLNVYGPDIAAWVADISDPLKLTVADYLVVIARGALMPAAAMLMTISIVVHAHETAAARASAEK
jgi:hypothetical protein